MRTYLFGFIASLLVILSVGLYLRWNAQQLLHALESMPYCFPPYIMMNYDVGHAPHGAYLSQFGADDGLITRTEPCSVNLSSHSEESQ